MSIAATLATVQRAIRRSRLSAWRWVDALWGYDVFIAHRRSDAAGYAHALYERLTAERISCFIDRIVYVPGDSLFVATSRHVAKSTVLIVVGSPDVLDVRRPVDWIEREIETYLATHEADPKIVLIDFGATIENALAVDMASNSIVKQVEPFIRLAEPISGLSSQVSESVLAAVRSNLDGRRRDRTRLQLFRGIAAVLSIFFLVAALLGVYAWQQKDAAEAETARARANEYSAKAKTLLSSNPRAALLVAIEGIRTTPSESPEPAAVESAYAAIDRIASIPLPGYGSFPGAGRQGASVAISADESRAAVGYEDGSVHAWDISNRRQPARLIAIPSTLGRWRDSSGLTSSPVHHVAVSFNGGRTAVSTAAGDSRQLLRVFPTTVDAVREGPRKPEYESVVDDVVKGPNGGVLVLLTRGRSAIEVLDLDSDDPTLKPTSLHHHERPIKTMAITSDGERIVALDTSGTILVHPVKSGTDAKQFQLPLMKHPPSGWERAAGLEEGEAIAPTDLRLSSDGRYLAVLARLPERGRLRYLVELWDLSLESPAVVAQFPRRIEEFASSDEWDENKVVDLEFSPDSQSLVVAHSSEVRLWKLRHLSLGGSADRVGKFGRSAVITGFSWAARRIAIGRSDGKVLLADLETLEALRTFELSSGDVTGEIEVISLSNSGRFVIAGKSTVAWLFDADSDLNVLRPPSLLAGDPVRTDGTGRVAAALSASGVWLASLTDLTTRILPLPDFGASRGKTNLHLCPNGRCAIIANDSAAKLFVVDLGAGIGEATVTAVDYGGDPLTKLTFDRDGRWCVISDGKKRALLVSLYRHGQQNPIELRRYAGGGLTFSPRSQWLLADMERPPPPLTISSLSQVQQPHLQRPPPLSNDTRTLLEERRVVLWRLEGERADDFELTDHPHDKLDSLTFSEDGLWLAGTTGPKIGSNEEFGKLFVWPLDLRSGPKTPIEIRQHEMRSGAKFSADGRWMISFDNLPGRLDEKANDYLPKTLRIWRLPTLDKPVWEDSFRAQTISAEFSADNSWLTVGTAGGATASLIDLKHEPVGAASLPIHSGDGSAGTTSVVFSPDHQWFVTNSFEVSRVTSGYQLGLRLWRLAGRSNVSQSEMNLAGSGARVAFSRDSRMLAVSDDRSTRILWLSDQTPLRRITLSEGGNPIFDETGSRLFLASGKGVKIYDLSVVARPSDLSALIGRNLTWEEWTTQFPGRPYAKTIGGLPAHPSVAKALLEQAKASKTTAPDRILDAYGDALSWALESRNPGAANDAAWWAGIGGFPRIALPAAEYAVNASPDDGNFRDTRGTIRCMLGDVSGALQDFEAYVAWATQAQAPSGEIEQQRGWINELKIGRKPKDSCSVPESLR